MTDLPISFRPATDNDMAYIFDTWFNGFRKTHPNNHMPSQVYLTHQSKMIESCLKDATTIVCCMDDDPDTIIGYLTARPLHGDSLLIHYGYVKGWARRNGIMRELLKQFDSANKSLVCTHFFKLFPDLKEKYKLIYDPSIAWELLYERF